MISVAHRLAISTTLLFAAAAVGCDRTDSTTATPANSGTGMTGEGSGKQVTVTGVPADSQGAGGAPTYGEPTGTGFPTGDSAHASGGGSGLMGFHGTGAMGTSAAVSDMHKVGEPAKNATPPVLPEQ